MNYTQYNTERNNKIIICGLGQSLQSNSEIIQYSGIDTFGINDCNKYLPTKYLICVNEESTFPNRWEWIYNSDSQFIFSQLNLKIKNENNLIKFPLGTRDEINLDKPEIDFSWDSPFMATILAHKMGYNQIGLIGTDLKDHRLTKYLDRIVPKYFHLQKELNSKGTSLFNLSPNSQLTEIPQMNLIDFIKK